MPGIGRWFRRRLGLTMMLALLAVASLAHVRDREMSILFAIDELRGGFDLTSRIGAGVRTERAVAMLGRFQFSIELVH